MQHFDISTLHRRRSAGEEQVYEPDREVGKPTFRRFIIATRPLTGAWPRAAQHVIVRARKAYDAGTHMMCHGIDRRAGVVILYSWKRREPVKPMHYFFEEQNHA